ncbi:N-6 DNA methylase [Streptomyces sp. NPDC001848]|uniref:type I restriction-modification system subunit M n=1 Tax=Streptomyces sp. NPDC001848 TaxID=3364618 RepID=UPI003685FDDF
MISSKHTELANHVWSVADLLRGDYKQSDYGKVILPFTVLRRLECVLEPTREKVSELAARYKDGEIDPDGFLCRASGHSFYNRSGLTLKKIAADPQDAAKNLQVYVGAFSDNARGVLDRFDFARQVRRLDDAGLLYKVIGRFTDLDLHPAVVPNHNMGYIFEELIRRFAEQSNETAGEHFTPREVIKLMVELLIAPDGDALHVPGVVRTVMDPACGTGGMLSATDDHIKALNPDATVEVFGQELNPESWAICRSDLMIKGQNPENIVFGNSFSDDGHKRRTFDYLLANPPFGVEWKKVKEEVEHEHRTLGEAGRFGAGLPRINDGSLLFLQHMISKMKPVDVGGGGGSRIAIVFNGSPLFTGAAGSGESEIRRRILENDWLEGIVALPDQLFYNTGIATYFWLLTNRKSPDLKGKVILLDARDQWQRMRKSLGDKRKELGSEHIATVVRLYGEALAVAEDPEHPLHGKVKVFSNEDFGYRRITVERPLRLRFEVTEETPAALAAAKPVQKLERSEEFVAAVRTLSGSSWGTKSEAFAALEDAVVAAGLLWPAGAPFAKAVREAIGVRDAEGEVQQVKGVPEADPELRDYENVPLGEDVEEYLKREVHPHVPDAWIDHGRTRTGYEIPFTRHFHVYKPPRPLAEIDAELKALEAEIRGLLGEVTE